ncbi:unnamed protein product [Cylicostephanus goldi]|uniref:Uncharacterized protein n=1 Tax=Cylicostephanus goldi TaxID=71465 RepID=A0A3P6TNZ7_CYLGO|nr:unnamed protein product [Cylicostephanus goldi]
MKTTVKAIEGYPCVFKSDDLGLIDDPHGALSLLHLSPYCKSSVVVSLSDSPSMISRFRFRVVDIQPDKGPKLEKWMKENTVCIHSAKAAASLIVFDSFSYFCTFFSSTVSSSVIFIFAIEAYHSKIR